MRLSILILAGMELLLLVAGIVKLSLGGIGSDQAGQAMGLAYAVIGAVIATLLLVPALILAYHDRLLWLALTLALLACIGVLVVLVAG